MIQKLLPGAAIAAAALALPGTALAATAPTRYIGFATSGLQNTRGSSAVAIAADGHEVLLNTDTNAAGAKGAAIHDLVSGTTTALPIPSYASIASNDLQRILFYTTARLDPADTNDGYDAYVYDRATDRTTYVSRPPSGNAPWSSGTGLPELDLARDGRAVYYSGSAPFPTGTYRYDLSSGAVTKVSDAQMENDQIDDAGRVIGTSRGLLVDGRTLPYPAPIPVTLTDTNFLTVKTSPDGSAALLLYGTRVFLMNTATGTSRELSYPSSLGQASWIVGVANGGGSYTVADNVRRADGTMVLFAERVDTATGAVTQIGGDIPSNTIGDAITAMTPDGSFAASATTLGALGTLPIPGTQHPIPQINPTKYVKFYPGCSYGSWLAPAVKAYFLTPGLEVGVIDHQTPASVLVTVYEGSPLKLTNQFTVKPSAGNVNHGLVTPTNGGFSYRAAVTFTDGTTRTGFGTIPPYTPMKNDRTIWDAGICSNGLGGGPLT